MTQEIHLSRKERALPWSQFDIVLPQTEKDPFQLRQMPIKRITPYADVVYKINTEVRGTDLGDVFRYNLAGEHQLWPWKTADRLLLGVLEINGVYQERDWMDGTRVSDSGGHTVYLSPGLQFVTKRFILESGAQVPVVQDLRGNQLETDISVNLGGRIQF